jgi:hypothetical protein
LASDRLASPSQLQKRGGIVDGYLGRQVADHVDPDHHQDGVAIERVRRLGTQIRRDIVQRDAALGDRFTGLLEDRL